MREKIKEYLSIFKLSLPIIISFLSYQVLGITDMIMVGRLGADSVAAVGVAITLFMFVSLPLEGFFDSSLILLSKAFGAKDEVAFKKVLMHELILGLICSVIGVMLYPGLKFILQFMSPTKEVFNYSAQYLLVVLIGLIPYIFNWIFTKSFIAMGQNKPLAYISNIVVALNILLNYIFIFGKFGVPAFGVIGSAIATAIARCVQSLLLIMYGMKIFKNNFKEHYRFRFDKSLIKDIGKLGYPIAQGNFVEIAGWTVFVGFISRLGVAALAAHEICMKIKDIAFMPGMALSNVGTSLIGGDIGRNDYVSTRRNCKNIIIVAILVMGAVGIFIYIFPEQLLGLFTNDLEIIEIGKKLLSLLIVYQVIDAVFIVFRGALNGIGATTVVRNVIIVGAWIIMIPSAFILINYTNVGVLGAWLSLTLNVLISGIIMGNYFIKNTKNHLITIDIV